MIVDATECEIERPEKNRKNYSGKKKRHTMKLQIIADAKTKDVICIAIAAGKVHDFSLFKNSCVHFLPETEVLADKGYQGIAALHANFPLCLEWENGP